MFGFQFTDLQPLNASEHGAIPGFLVDVVDDFRETLSRWLTVQENAVLEESDGRCGLVLTSEP